MPEKKAWIHTGPALQAPHTRILPPATPASSPLENKRKTSQQVDQNTKQTNKTEPGAGKEEQADGDRGEGEGCSEGTGTQGPRTRTPGWGLTDCGRERGWQGRGEQGGVGGGEVGWDNYNTTTTTTKVVVFFFKEHEFPVICEWEYLLSHETHARPQGGKP